jgi:hypothetical protein
MTGVQDLAWRSGESLDYSDTPNQFHCEHTSLLRLAETHHVIPVEFGCHWLLGKGVVEPGSRRRNCLIISVDLILMVSPLLHVGWLKLTG